MNTKLQELKISVLMSAYNETEEELLLSIDSILNQSYKNIEFIIVNDNPNNIDITNAIKKRNDKRIKIIVNDTNKGLVNSLNIALKSATGEIIARMDADDIAESFRLEQQMEYMNDNGMDLIGCNIRILDMMNLDKSHVMCFPSKGIVRFIKWGNCLAHPTWIGRKEVFDSLDGYRQIPRCEDYDFVLRALGKGYCLGNAPIIGLCYRVRNNSISNSGIAEQYILRRHLASLKNIASYTEQQVNDYMLSDRFKREVRQYNEYMLCKSKVKKGSFYSIIEIIFNKYLYLNIIERLFLFLRSKV